MERASLYHFTPQRPPSSNSQGSARLNPGARISVQVSHVGGTWAHTKSLGCHQDKTEERQPACLRWKAPWSGSDLISSTWPRAAQEGPTEDSLGTRTLPLSVGLMHFCCPLGLSTHTHTHTHALDSTGAALCFPQGGGWEDGLCKGPS